MRDDHIDLRVTGSEQIPEWGGRPDDEPRPMTVRALGLPSPWQGVHATADLFRVAGGGCALASEEAMVS